jgi:co-chaperonin GroES (HSP10)
MSKLRAIHDHIIFQFKDESIQLNGMTHFVDKTKWGFLTSNVQRGMDYPRIGTVVAVGPEVEDKVKVGDEILVEPLMWTIGAKVDFDEYWRTDISYVIGVLPKTEVQPEPERRDTYLS